MTTKPRPIQQERSTITSQAFEFTNDDFSFVKELLYDNTGILLDQDKKEMAYGRVRKRIKALSMSSFEEYKHYLQTQQSKEFIHFINALTTNMTSFYREKHHFNYLIQEILRKKKLQPTNQRTFNIWSAGCSTGQEPYSIALTILQEPSLAKLPITITATDIDTDVLNTAKSGTYLKSRITGLSPQEINRFFRLNDDNPKSADPFYQVTDDVKRMIQFRPVNLMKPWHFAQPFDVIFCRNVTIYFDRETQCTLFQRFSKQLVSEGHLFIGHSETIDSSVQVFTKVAETTYQLTLRI